MGRQLTVAVTQQIAARAFSVPDLAAIDYTVSAVTCRDAVVAEELEAQGRCALEKRPVLGEPAGRSPGGGIQVYTGARSCAYAPNNGENFPGIFRVHFGGANIISLAEVWLG